MAAATPVLLFAGGIRLVGIRLVAAAQRPGTHAGMLERLGGPMLVSGLVGLGAELAHVAG